MKILVIDKIQKSFGGLQALHDVSLEVEEGERRVIIGPNGAGKTTLFHIISGIENPTSGAVYLSGRNITHLPTHRRADLGISQTFQIISLFKRLTTLENTVLSLQALKSIKYTFYRRLGGYKHIFHFGEEFLKEWGLWQKRDTKVSDLSYGDQRLLDLMLALACKPLLLLLDEPTSGLPLADIKDVVSRIEGLSRKITILIIEHKMDVALNLADRVTVLHMGEVVTEGTPVEMRKDPRVKDIYLGTERE